MAENLAITFDNWIITPPDGIIARQYDNLSRDLVVAGTFPEGYLWEMLIWCKGNYNTLAMTQSEGQLSTTLTDEDLAFDGYYKMQLRGTIGEEVRHTNVICVKIPCSIDGDVNWPEIPSIYREYLQQVQQLVQDAQDYAGNAETNANDAVQAAQTASGAATQAQEYAQTAETASTNAQDAASTAQSAESDAQQHADNAQASADQAAQSAAETADKIPLSQKGAAGGVATLDDNSLVPTAQIPIIPVTKGGTGSDDYNEGRINIGAASNPNLLDNWYLVGGGSQQGGGQFPINQRGKTSYSPNGHTIDRWTIDNGIVLSLQENGLQMQITNATYLRQQLENPDKLQGQTVTLSGVFTNTQSLDDVVLRVRVNNSFKNRLVNITGNGLFSATTVLPDSIETMSFEVGGNPGSQLTITALKLELGPVQTLAHQDADGNWVLNDPPPNFQQELAKCQRYLRVISAKGPYAHIPGTGLTGITTTSPRFVFSSDMSMRITPTVTIDNLYIFSIIDGKEQYLLITGIQWVAYDSPYLRVALTTETASAQNTSIISLSSYLNREAKIVVSAEL